MQNTILEDLCKHVVGPKPKRKATKRMNTCTWDPPREIEPGRYIIGEDPAIQCGFNPKNIYKKEVYDRAHRKRECMKSKLQEAIWVIITYAISKGVDAFLQFLQTYRELSRFASDEYPRSSAVIIHVVMVKDSAMWSVIPPLKKGDLYKYLSA